MRIYFDHIDAIHRFTMELDRHRDTIKCWNCLRCSQFLSHGFVYKKQDNGERKAVGKRLFCSNRHGKSGCGRTTRLYLAIQIRRLQYTGPHLFIFLAALLSMSSIQKSYKAATGTDDPRNAYRWLHRLWNKLIEYRRLLKIPDEDVAGKFKCRVWRLQILLPTIQGIFFKIEESSLSLHLGAPCACYQMITQSSFV